MQTVSIAFTWVLQRSDLLSRTDRGTQGLGSAALPPIAFERPLYPSMEFLAGNYVSWRENLIMSGNNSCLYTTVRICHFYANTKLQRPWCVL